MRASQKLGIRGIFSRRIFAQKFNDMEMSNIQKNKRYKFLFVKIFSYFCSLKSRCDSCLTQIYHDDKDGNRI